MSDSKKLVLTDLEGPEVGAVATHTGGRLDARIVSDVSEDNQFIWLDLYATGRTGPYPADNYTYKRREWV